MDGEQLMICDSTVFIDPDDIIKINGEAFRGTDGLWELLRPNNVNTVVVNKADLNLYNKLLIISNAHSKKYQLDDSINITRGKKFRDIIAPSSRN